MTTHEVRRGRFRRDLLVIPRPLTPKAVRLRDEYQRQIHELLAPAVFIDEVAGALTERQKTSLSVRRLPSTPRS